MTKISAIILADNKEDIIEKCFKTINWVDEKILVDLGSQDNTLTIAKKYGSRIIKGNSDYNFSLWRNQGAKVANGEWLLYIDADERVSSALKEEIQSIIPALPAGRHHPSSIINGYYIPRKNYFLGKEFRTAWPDYQLRLIRKDKLTGWQGNIHETPKINGKVGTLVNPLIHLAHQNLEDCLANTLKWSKLEAENRFKLGHPKMSGLRFLHIIATGFWQQFVKQKVWREGVEGVIDGIYQVFSLFITYVRLWELQRKEPLKDTYKKIDQEILKKWQ